MNSNQTSFMPTMTPEKVRVLGSGLLGRELSLGGLLYLVDRNGTVKCQGFEMPQGKCRPSSRSQLYQITGGKTIIMFLSKEPCVYYEVGSILHINF